MGPYRSWPLYHYIEPTWISDRPKSLQLSIMVERDFPCEGESWQNQTRNFWIVLHCKKQKWKRKEKTETPPASVGLSFYTNGWVWQDQETTKQHNITVYLLPCAWGYLIPLLKVWCNLKRACRGKKKTLASLWIAVAFRTQVKLWSVSCDQTQTIQYVTFPLGFADCVIIGHVFVMIIRAASLHFKRVI